MYDRQQIIEARSGYHFIEFQPGYPSKRCTVTKVQGEHVWVQYDQEEATVSCKLNKTASQLLIQGQYRSQQLQIYPLADLSQPKDVQAIKTNEFRCPQKGEWYLSGAIPEAYQAKSDLQTPYHICKLVVTKTETIKTIVKEL